MRYFAMILLVALLAGCGPSAPTTYAFEFEDDGTLTERNSQLDAAATLVNNVYYVSFTAEQRRYGMQISFQEEPLAPGDVVPYSILVEIPHDIENSPVPYWVRCVEGGLDGPPEDVVLRITEVRRNRISGQLRATVDNCFVADSTLPRDDIESPYETLNIRGSFSSIRVEYP